MTVCPSTGVGVPECSCRRCVEAQIRLHQPALLATAEVTELGTARAGAGTSRGAAQSRRAA